MDLDGITKLFENIAGFPSVFYSGGTRFGNVGETSKSKLDFESIQLPPHQASPQIHTPKTHKLALPDYSWRTSPRESSG